jgi:hypothetical protein
MERGSRVMSYLWDYEEIRRKQVTGDEYQADTVVAVDGFPTIGKNMTEKMVSLQAALNVVGHAGRDMSNSVQHF